jgi:hypothetical protein
MYGRLAMLSLCLAALAGPSLAEGIILPGSKSRSALFKAQTRLLDTRLAKQYENADRGSVAATRGNT